MTFAANSTNYRIDFWLELQNLKIFLEWCPIMVFSQVIYNREAKDRG